MKVLKLIQEVVWANSHDTSNMAAVYSFVATVTVTVLPAESVFSAWEQLRQR